MKNWSKKMISVAIVTLLIGSSNLHSEDDDHNQYKQFSLYDPSENADNALFDFMRKSQILWSLSQIAIGMQNFEQIEKIVSLPFLDLHEQLSEKLKALTKAEEDFGASNASPEDWKTFVNWKKEIEAMPCCATKEDFESQLKAIFDSCFHCSEENKVYSSKSPHIGYQNILDEISLIQAYKYDVQQQLSLIYREEDPIQKEILLREAMEYNIASYEMLIEANKNTFEKIQEIANNGFKEEIFSTIHPKREIEFQSLPEVLVYAKIMQHEDGSQKMEL